MAGAPFDWAEYLTLATILSRNHDEASHRTSMSRAYYSVFHAASARAIGNGYSAGQNSHQAIWKVFAKDTNKDAKRLAQWGNTMKRVRELVITNPWFLKFQTRWLSNSLTPVIFWSFLDVFLLDPLRPRRTPVQVIGMLLDLLVNPLLLNDQRIEIGTRIGREDKPVARSNALVWFVGMSDLLFR